MVTTADLQDALDVYGVTLVNMIDQVDGAEVPALDWIQVLRLMNGVEKERESVRQLWVSSRKHALNLDSALTRAYTAARPGQTAYESVESVPTEVEQAIAEARSERDVIEVTDEMIDIIGREMFGPAVVYDREKVRRALESALQVR